MKGERGEGGEGGRDGWAGDSCHVRGRTLLIKNLPNSNNTHQNIFLSSLSSLLNFLLLSWTCLFFENRESWTFKSCC